jgi:hypothetical protein
MKTCFIFLISFLFITACNDSTVKYVEVPASFENIEFKHNLQESNFMTDEDTLKIEILDTNLIDPKYLKNDLFTVEAQLSSSAAGTKNHIFELISSDLYFEINPNNEYEMWVMNFKPNLDSTRTYGVSRYTQYVLIMKYSKVDERYRNSYINFYVESTTE